MNFESLRHSLSRMPAILTALVRDLPQQDLLHSSPTGGWSILEIVCHLVDEETKDFRPRLESTLVDPLQAWESYDPEAMATQNDYRGQDITRKIDQFNAERQKSLDWLSTLDCETIDWDQSYQHPRLGAITAGDLLAAWVAHDHLHIRQIAKRLFEMAQRDGAPYAVDYAGQWKA